MVEVIEAAYRLTTPLFSSGAEPEDAELRSASFRGVLRFWWRALAWSRWPGELEKIRQAEEALFGSASPGRGKVTLRLDVTSKEVSRWETGRVLQDTGATVGEGARYLGYGVMKPAGQLTRSCILARLDFLVQLRCRDLEAADLKLLLDALKALGLLGGLGARSRRGYGSVVLRQLKHGDTTWHAPEDVQNLAAEIRSLNRDWPTRPELPPYTALSSQARDVLRGGEGSALRMLDRVGREMVRFRSWGNKGVILGKEKKAVQFFEDDHDLMKSPPAQRNSHPRRIVFGLPHNYGKKKEEKVEPADEKLDRRASPLFIHVHECGTKPVLVLAFFPAVFLPSAHGGRPRIDVGGKKVPLKSEDELWQPIRDFLDRLSGKAGQCQETFEPREEVSP